MNTLILECFAVAFLATWTAVGLAALLILRGLRLGMELHVQPADHDDEPWRDSLRPDDAEGDSR